jgi:hypothetical protein
MGQAIRDGQVSPSSVKIKRVETKFFRLQKNYGFINIVVSKTTN